MPVTEGRGWGRYVIRNKLSLRHSRYRGKTRNTQINNKK
jgi:hypothetical protein